MFWDPSYNPWEKLPWKMILLCGVGVETIL